MFFWFKKPEIVLDCFTYSYFAYDYAKIDHAVKFIPDWWKNTPKIQNNDLTIKNCTGLIDFYKNGIIIPSWFEMELNVLRKGDPERFRWIASNGDVASHGSHSPNQFLGFAEEDGVNLKIQSPWFLRTKEKVNFIWSQPTWNFKNFMPNATILPAVVNYKQQNETHINFFLQNSEDQEKIIKIPPATPLVILHPMSNKKIKIKHHLVSIEECERLFRGYMGMFLIHNPETQMTKTKRKNEFLESLDKKIVLEKENKCPFISKDSFK